MYKNTSYIIEGVNSITWKSAAQPDMCCELLAPPTSLLTCGHLYPDVIITGAQNSSLIGSRTLSTSKLILRSIVALASKLGSFLIPFLSAVDETKNSDNLKFFMTNDFNVKHMFVHPSALRLGCFYNKKGERIYS